MSDWAFSVGDRVIYTPVSYCGERDYSGQRIGTVIAINPNGVSGARGGRSAYATTYVVPKVRVRVEWDARTTPVGIDVGRSITWVMAENLSHADECTSAPAAPVCLHRIPEAVDLVAAFDEFVQRVSLSANQIGDAEVLARAVEAFREPKQVEAMRLEQV